MLVKRLRRFGLALLALAAASSVAAAAAPRNDAFTVSPIPVDATAANATAARDQAVAEAEQKGFRILIERLVSGPADRAKLPKLSNDDFNRMVQGFEVANERRSGVRYIADFTVHFRPDAVRRYLRDANIPFAETSSKALLVLPVLKDGDRLVLWDDPNPWRDAWARAKLAGGLVPLVRPVGELDDVAAIDADAAVKGDPARLRAISARYDNADVLVTTATLKGGDAPAMEIKSTRYAPGTDGEAQSWTTTVAAGPGESDAAMLAHGVAETVTQVETAWKTANTLDFSRGGTLLARVPTSDLREWVAVRNRLAGIPAVRASQLLALDRSGAQVQIRYAGDPEQLRQALLQHGLDLGGGEPEWTLQRRDGAGPPR